MRRKNCQEGGQTGSPFDEKPNKKGRKGCMGRG